MRRPYEARGPGLVPRRGGWQCAGRMAIFVWAGSHRAASVAFGRGGGRAVEPGSNREPSRWLPPSRRNCLW